MKTCVVVLFLLATIASAQSALSAAEIDAIYPDIEALYIDLHRTPELSLQEQETAGKMADGLRRLGFEITTGVGGNGVVGVLRNGSGPTVLIRTDMDGLPVEEKTGLPYASRVKVKDASGAEVGVMHACGHDVHMAAWMGTARLLAGAGNAGDDRAAGGRTRKRRSGYARRRSIHEVSAARLRSRNPRFQ